MEMTYGKSFKESTVQDHYHTLGNMVREYISSDWISTNEIHRSSHTKQVYYLSIEFLLGRLLGQNLLNLGIREVVKEGLSDLNISLENIEEIEVDAGLGNGGLGRLAACFLDSLASLNLPGHGYGIRYKHGLFDQKIVNGFQIELPEQWLRHGNSWEVRKLDQAIEVNFWGEVEMVQEDGKFSFRHVKGEPVSAVPYDIPVIGYKTDTVNTLRLWNAEPSSFPVHKDVMEYKRQTEAVSEFLYPDDTHEDGKILRLKQQYFLVSASLQSIIRAHRNTYQTLTNFHEKVAIHINDTHPVLAIPELMRILLDEEKMEWEDAWHITSNTISYTNHTTLSEALEKWPIDLFQPLLPRVYMIIEEINERFCKELWESYPGDWQRIENMAILAHGLVKMAHLAIVGSYKVNGVAKIHTDILKERDVKDPSFLQGLKTVKQQRKKLLADIIQEQTGIKIDSNSIFDVQVKRLHAYKRQLLNVLHIMYLYNRLKEDPNFQIVPRTFIFGAKASPGYYYAKKVIKLINSVADVVNHDPQTSPFLKVVFLENYRVSLAEYIFPAADVSEQISTASKEASGTGNMKFMMNGALTLGTMDGANVEISEAVGKDNVFIFGLKAEEVLSYQQNGGYRAYDYYHHDKRIRQVLERLTNGFLPDTYDLFEPIYDSLLMQNDEYYVLRDFDSYVTAQQKVNEAYRNENKWLQMSATNIAHSGFFSSDRTIEEYASDIWGIHSTKNLLNQ